MVARYRYGAFGETQVAEGPLAASFPFRWSARYRDAATGFLYVGNAPQAAGWTAGSSNTLSLDPVVQVTAAVNRWF